MYRALVLFPTAAGREVVDALIEAIATSFKANGGSEPVTRSVGPLMGPGARAEAAGWVLEADFPTIDAAMAALQAEDFQDVKERTEQLGSTLFLFEVQAL